MLSPSIDIVLENQNLKNEFTIRNLDLSQIWQPTPDDLELENRQLRHLLDWVDKYNECPDRKKLEALGYLFPPISFDIDPEADWYRFKRWMRGLPTRKTLVDQLPPGFKIRTSEEIPEEEIEAALDELIKQLERINYGISIANEVPPRLIYEDLLEILDEEHEMLGMPGWCLDGCDGYCPGCFQRPWCEQGGNCCWQEDEKAGRMVFPDSVKRYVAASPVSLQILQACQAEEDQKMAEFMAQNAGKMKVDSVPNFDDFEDDEDSGDLPF